MSYSSEVLADSPLGYYPLDDLVQMVDASGNGRHGGYLGASTAATGLVNGDSNGARSFSSSSKGYVPTAAWMSASSFTIVATIKPTGVTGTQTIAARYDGLASGVFNGSAFSFRLNGNKLECHIFSGNTAGAATTTVSLTAGTVYDVAATYDGTTVKVYVNGGSVVSATRTGMNSSSYPLTIASTYSSGTESFTGVIDDVAYIGSVLSASDLSTLSTTRTSGSGYAAAIAAFSPLAYYRLGEATTGTSAMADGSGNSHPGNYTGWVSPAPSLVPSTSDAATAFSSAGSGVATVPYAVWMAVTSFTAEAWITPSTVSGTQVVMSRQGGSGGTWIWTLRLEGTSLKFYYWNASNVLQTALVGSTTFVAGTTYHVAATFSASGTATVYVNGSSVGSASTTTLAASTAADMRVGASGVGEYFGGTIDEAAFYSSVLTSTRIAAHYTAGITTPNATVTPPAATATAAAVAPVVSATAGVVAPVGTATAAALAPAIGAGATVVAPVETATAAAVAPTVSTGAIVSAVAATATSAAFAPSVSGNNAASVVAPAASASAAVLPPTLAWGSTLSAAVAQATADALAPTLSFGATIAAPAATATADALAPVITNVSSDATVSAVPATATATAIAPAVFVLYETDTSNAFDGLDLLPTMTVTFAVPVATPPTTLVVAHKVDKALAYPVPTMVGGRPT